MLNVVLGIVGAVLGGWLLSNFVGASTINQGACSENPELSATSTERLRIPAMPRQDSV